MHKNFYLKSLVSSLSEERGIEENVIYSILEEAIFSIFSQRFKCLNLSLSFDRDTCIYDVYSNYFLSSLNKFGLSLRRSFFFLYQDDNYLHLDCHVRKKITGFLFKRREFNEAKLIIFNKLMLAEKKSIKDNYDFFINKTVVGVVRRVIDVCYLLIIEKNIYGILNMDEIIPYETIDINTKLKVYVKSVIYYDGEPYLFLSRVCDELLIDLLKLEIPEISNGIIEIKSIVRYPGVRSKIVINTENFFDPIGMCLGFNGLRIKNVSNALNYEKIDLILWNKDLKCYFVNMFPYMNIYNIELNYKKKIAYFIVDESCVPVMIGERGINVALLNKLTSWRLKILNTV
ncbi:MAG TPA: NusA N-terminal domain-containing protein [Candidatus Azoamicus sp. OHIO2]